MIVILSINIGDIFVRNLIQEVINKKEAGYWTAMTSVSKIYMQFTAVIFPLYILPKYASITKTFEFRQEVFKIYKRFNTTNKHKMVPIPVCEIPLELK